MALNNRPEPLAKAIIYARVSSKDQEKEGFSLPSQLKLLHGYAAAQRMLVVQEYVESETAKQSGRAQFEAMIRYVQAHPSVRIILVEKTDRLYRNFFDYVRLDVERLDLEVHLVKDNVVLTRDSRSHDKFMHGIKVLMAKNYVDNLSEETKKGMLEKAEQGIWPSQAPIGYLNVKADNDKQIITVDPKLGPVVTKLFSWYATGFYSLDELAGKALECGWVHKKTGGLVPRSTLHRMLSKRIYTGDFEWKGVVYHGTHEPLVTRAIWEKVQDTLDERDCRKVRGKKEFAFSGLMTCGHCGCALVAQLQKGKSKKGNYIYYRCSGFKGKCPERYVREEVIAGQFAKALGGLRISEETLQFLKRAIQESHGDEREAHEEAVRQLQAEYDRLNSRVHAAYVDKLEGTIDKAMYESLSNRWRLEQSKLLDEIAAHQRADQSYMDAGIRLLELACHAPSIFKRQPPKEQGRLLKAMLSNTSWR